MITLIFISVMASAKVPTVKQCLAENPHMSKEFCECMVKNAKAAGIPDDVSAKKHPERLKSLIMTCMSPEATAPKKK